MISQTQLDEWHNSSRRVKSNHAKLLTIIDEMIRTIESVNALEQRAIKTSKR